MRHWQATLVVVSLSLAVSAHAALKISDKPTTNVDCMSGVCTAAAKSANLAASDLIAMLSAGDVTVASGAAAKDIQIDTALRWTSPHHLTLDSFHAIAFNRPVVVTGTGALTITTNDGGKNGDFHFFGKAHVEFRNTTSALTINGNPYLLASSIKQILALRTPKNEGISFIALARSFNLSKKAYSASPIAWYQGIFEGLGNTISNLTVSNSTDDCVGLFGCEDDLTPSIRDIGVLNANIQGSTINLQSVGALAGYTHGDIVGAYASGQVSGTGPGSSVGGLVGAGIGNTIRYSHASVAVTGAGHMTAVGGLAGSIVGDCLGGTCEGLVDESYATGSATGGDGTEVGGLVGFNISDVITDCYATGAVNTGAQGFAGGLIGFSEDDDAEKAIAIVLNAYSTGVVQGVSNASVGGFVGYDIAAGHRSHLYWDLDTSGITDPGQGAGFPANDPDITGLTTAQLTFGLPLGFSTQYWAQSAKVNGGFPYLAANPPQ